MAAAELAGPLEMLPRVDFCCAYGSFLLPNSETQNLERNKNHYSSFMARLGPRAISFVADRVGVGVHFNPFVTWRDKMIKYGVVRMQDLVMDVLTWNRFYLSGRLQKPVEILVDEYDIRKLNAVNLRAAISAALLLSEPEFSEEELYMKICGLSYSGDLRMLFAEDKNKVKKIVRGKWGKFQEMYRPCLNEHLEEGLLESTGRSEGVFKQDCGLAATRQLFLSLPKSAQGWLGKTDPGEVQITRREMAGSSTRNALRRLVMVSSARQALSGLLAAGGANAARYLGRKIEKAWRSRGTSNSLK
ncbi:translocator assembly/maintenance protein isoform X1 [Wolffia australiana]